MAVKEFWYSERRQTEAIAPKRCLAKAEGIAIKPDLQHYLEELPLFSELTGPEINLLVPLCRLIEGGIGHYLLHEGEPVRNIYVLVSGEATVRKEQKQIATIGKGAVIGEMTLLNHTPAFATIQAKGPFKAIAIDQLAFSKLLEEHARLASVILKKIARTLSLRLMMTDARLAEALSIPHDYKEEQKEPEGP